MILTFGFVLKITARSADRSARSDAGDKVRDLAFSIPPEFGPVVR